MSARTRLENLVPKTLDFLVVAVQEPIESCRLRIPRAIYAAAALHASAPAGGREPGASG
jgi:hypothetical protein